MKFAHRVLAAVLLLMFSRIAVGDPAIDQAIDELLKEPNLLVSKWERYASVALYIVVAVGMVGIMTTVVQLLPLAPAWGKFITGAFGALVGGLTVVSNSVLDFDRRQYENLASIGRQTLNEIRAKRHTLGDLPQNDTRRRDEIIELVRSEANRVMKLAERVRADQGLGEDRGKGKAEKSGIGFFIGTAFASDGGLPGWTVTVPSDDTNLYFVGYAEGRDYVSARQTSRDQAYEDARQYLSDRFSVAAPGFDQHQSNSLAAYLLESARVLSTHYVYDKSAQIYRFYSLFGLSRKIASTDLRLYTAKNKVVELAELDAALRKSTRTQSDYISSRLTVYRAQTAKAQETMSRKQFDEYIKARELRFDDKFGESIVILKELVREKPDFYLGWFNLARAYEDDKRLEEARTAYQRAVDIARKEGIKDASLYNSYGYLLYRMRRYLEAVAMLEKALEFAPDHPKARGTLTAAKAGR